MWEINHIFQVSAKSTPFSSNPAVSPELPIFTVYFTSMYDQTRWQSTALLLKSDRTKAKWPNTTSKDELFVSPLVVFTDIQFTAALFWSDWIIFWCRVNRGNLRWLCQKEETAASCVPMTNVKWREVKPHHHAPVSLHTCWPLHHTSFRLLVKDMMVEFLSNDLKTKKAFILITFYGFMSLVQQWQRDFCHTSGERNLSILPARKGLPRMLLTEGLSRGLRLNSWAKSERRSCE